MPLAIFDLDNTLLAGDSDHAWCEYLIERGVLDEVFFQERNDRFYREYQAGTLNIFEFLDFQLRPLAEHPMATLQAWHADFMTSKVLPMIAPGTPALLRKHREAEHTMMIITATNRFVTDPIARHLEIPHLIATDPEMVDGAYTGRVAGEPSFREGKVNRLKTWLEEQNANLEGSYFYSDSRNDIPLLELVTYPVAVNPDPALAEHAKEKGWRVMDLRK